MGIVEDILEGIVSIFDPVGSSILNAINDTEILLSTLVNDSQAVILNDIAYSKNLIITNVESVNQKVKIIDIQVGDIYKYLINNIMTGINSLENKVESISDNVDNVLVEIRDIPDRTANLVLSQITATMGGIADSMYYLASVVDNSLLELQISNTKDMHYFAQLINDTIIDNQKSTELLLSRFSDQLHSDFNYMTKNISKSIDNQSKIMNNRLSEVSDTISREFSDMIQFQSQMYMDFKAWVNDMTKVDPAVVISTIIELMGMFSKAGGGEVAGVELPKF